MVSLQSFSSKSQRPKKLKTTFAARKLELCFRRNVVGETIGHPEDSLRRKLFILVSNDQASWLRSQTRWIQKRFASLGHVISFYRFPVQSHSYNQIRAGVEGTSCPPRAALI